MQVPNWLAGEAKSFWKKHYLTLKDAGILKPDTVDGFALLCEVYRLLRNCKPEQDSRQAISFIALLKQFQSLSKQYGLMPKDRAKLVKESAELDEFGLPS